MKEKRERRSDSVSNSPAVLCTGYDPHRPLSINHHHFRCQDCATSICVPRLKASISDGERGEGGKAKPVCFPITIRPPDCPLYRCPVHSLSKHASSILFCCQSQARPLFLSFLSTVCLLRFFTAAPPPQRLPSHSNLTPAFKWEINKSVCESHPRSLSLSLLAYSHSHTQHTVILLPSYPDEAAPDCFDVRLTDANDKMRSPKHLS